MVVWLCTTQVCRAQSAHDAPAIAWHRLLEQSTVAVAELQVVPGNADNLNRWLQSKVGDEENSHELSTWGDDLRNRMKLLHAMGVERLIVTYSTADLVSRVPVVICISDQVDPPTQIVADILQDFLIDETITARNAGDGLIVAGLPSAVQRVLTSDESIPTRLKTLLPDESTSHRLTYAPPAMIREAVAAFLPSEGPKGILSLFSPQQTLLDVNHTQLILKTDSELSLEAQLVASDPKAAERISSLLETPRLLPAGLDIRSAIRRDVKTLRIRLNNQDTQLLASSIRAMILQKIESDSQLRFRTIGLAFHNHHSAFKRFPEATFQDSQQNPLFSWRFKLIPFLGLAGLWDSIDRSQPWDSPENLKLANKMPAVFHTSGDGSAKTRLRLPIIEGSLWSNRDTEKTFASIADGSSHT
ncbi:MAG: DUF1559 domain-containing protein, partial [Planctomycetota bacterium]